MNETRYTPWKMSLFCQWPTIGSRWYRGNFMFGIAVDNHPRFVNLVLCIWFLEFGVGFTREPIEA